MTTTALDGTFASDRRRGAERWFQRVGTTALAGVAALALADRVGRPSDVGRAALLYVFLLAVFRVSGRRTLAQVTTFDLILVLILGDATQQALLGDNATFATSVVVVSTLVLIDIGLAWTKRRWPSVDALIDGLPVRLVVHGRQQEAQMAAECVTVDDVLNAAREQQGLSQLAQVEFAVLEQDGSISVVPRR